MSSAVTCSCSLRNKFYTYRYHHIGVSDSTYTAVYFVCEHNGDDEPSDHWQQGKVSHKYVTIYMAFLSRATKIPTSCKTQFATPFLIPLFIPFYLNIL